MDATCTVVISLQTCIEPSRELLLDCLMNELCRGISGFHLRYLLEIAGVGAGVRIMLTSVAKPTKNLMCTPAPSKKPISLRTS